MQETLIDQGVNLMLFGMGTVFVFLTILVFATALMSKLVTRFATAEGAEPVRPQATVPVTSGQSSVSPQVISAIEKAIAQHRQR